MLVGATITYRRPADASDQTGIVIVSNTITDYYSYAGVSLPSLVNGLLSSGVAVNFQYGACVVKGLADNVVRVVAYKDVKTVTNIQPDLPATTVNVAAPTVNNNVPVPSVTNNVNATAPTVNVASSPATVNVNATAPVVNNNVPVPSVSVTSAPATVSVNSTVPTVNVNAVAPVVNNNIPVPTVTIQNTCAEFEAPTINNNVEVDVPDMSTKSMIGKTVKYYRYFNSEITGQGVIADKVRVDQSSYYVTNTINSQPKAKTVGSIGLDAYLIQVGNDFEVIPCVNVIQVITD